MFLHPRSAVWYECMQSCGLTQQFRVFLKFILMVNQWELDYKMFKCSCYKYSWTNNKLHLKEVNPWIKGSWQNVLTWRCTKLLGMHLQVKHGIQWDISLIVEFIIRSLHLMILDLIERFLHIPRNKSQNKQPSLYRLPVCPCCVLCFSLLGENF